MQESGLSSDTIRILSLYVGQAVLGLSMLLIFRYFANLYHRSFLKTWSASWLAFLVFTLTTAYITYAGVEQLQGISRIVVTTVAMTASFCQVACVLAGSYELTRKWRFRKKHAISMVAGLLLISLFLVLYKHDDPEARMSRYVIRVGLKYLVLGTGFLIASIIALKHPRFTRGIGRQTLVLGYLTYALVAFYYVTVVACNVAGKQFPFPVFFGLVEMLSICFMGLGMVMWLLEDEREVLRKTNKELDSFLYSVSHDLRAPIASVLGLTNLAKLELKDEKSMEYISMIDTRIKKLDLVIEDILQLSRSTKAPLQIETIDFNKLLMELIADVKFNKGAHAITLRYEESPSHILMTDRAQLRIVLANLISNAVKYHKLNQPDPYLEVKFVRTSKAVIIVVSDNGEGIAKENQPRIFDMFYRASTHSDGTGLGLYIVKEAVTKIKGTIRVDSEPGKGTTFTISLPLQGP